MSDASLTSVQQWIRNYESMGADAFTLKKQEIFQRIETASSFGLFNRSWLRDCRGKRKRPNEMSELEKLRAEVKILRAEKEHAEMGAPFLKKLEEIDRNKSRCDPLFHSDRGFQYTDQRIP